MDGIFPTMVIKFSPPLAKDFGHHLQISLHENITVRNLLKEIAKRVQNFSASIETKGEDIRVHLMLTCKEKLLKMDDEINDEDIIEIFLPVSGGR